MEWNVEGWCIGVRGVSVTARKKLRICKLPMTFECECKWYTFKKIFILHCNFSLLHDCASFGYASYTKKSAPLKCFKLHKRTVKRFQKKMTLYIKSSKVKDTGAYLMVPDQTTRKGHCMCILINDPFIGIGFYSV